MICGAQFMQNKILENLRVIHVPYLFGLCMAFKKNVLLEIDGFDPFYEMNCAEDVDIGLRVRKNGYFLHYTPKAVVYHLHKDDENKLKQNQYNWY